MFFWRRRALTLAVFFAFMCGVLAPHAHASESLKHGLGFSGGYILGTGITYVHYLGPHMLQASFIGDVNRDDTDYRVGLSYARYLHRVDEPRSLLPVALKFIAGVDVRYQEGFVETDVIIPNEPILYQKDKAYFYHTGIGLGFDIGNPGKPGLVFSVMVSYALSLEEVNQKREWEVSPLPAVGILYSW